MNLILGTFSTIAYDDLAPPGQDERWEIFEDLHAYLEQRFPLVYAPVFHVHSRLRF